MLIEFITVSGWAFWIIIGAVVIFDVCCLSTEDDMAQGWAVFFTILVLIGFVLFTDVFVGVKISMLIASFAAYLMIGVVWSFKKWYDYLIERKRAQVKGSSNDKMPTATDNKQRITTWMSLWMFSMTWWVLTWPRKAFIWLYDRLSTIYDRIAKHVWESV